MKFIVKVSLCLCFFSMVFSCKKDNKFSSTPELKVRSFEKVGPNDAVWKLGFTDGDGDIGVRNDQDLDNFKVTIFAIIDGVPLERSGQSYRIPVVENIRTEKGIEGEFEFKFETDLLRLDSISYDSVFYRGFVLDRGGKQSNSVETPIFPI